jgi:protein SCO1
MKTVHYFLFGLASAVGLAAVVAYALFGRGYTYQGGLIDPPLPVADFRLTDQKGQEVAWSDLRGGTPAKVALVFFGFTHCTDICPATLADYKKIKAQLGSHAQDVRFVYISVDPERDTPEAISPYLSNFDPAFIGLTGSQADLQPVWKMFYVTVEKGMPDASGSYEVSHSARVYLIDRNGDLRLTYEFGTQPQAIAQDVEHLLEEK